MLLPKKHVILLISNNRMNGREILPNGDGGVIMHDLYKKNMNKNTYESSIN